MRIPKVSIVVVNAKTLKYLKNALFSIVNTINYKNYELIVIDCASPDFVKWIEDFKRNFPYVRVKYMHYHEDDGASAAHNKALQLVDVRSKYFIFLDSDVKVIDKEFVRTLVNVLHNEKEVAAVCPLIVNLDSPNEVLSAGCYLFPHMETYEVRDPKEIPHEDVYETFYISGSAFAIKRDVLDELASFSLPMYHEFFFLGHDDIDVSISLRLRGYRILLAKKARICHKGGATTKHLSPFRVYHAWKNILSIILMNYKKVSTILKVMPFVIIWQSLFLLKHMRDPLLILSTVRAYLWIIKNLRKLLHFRLRINKYRIHNDDHLMSTIYSLITENCTQLLETKKRYGEIYKHYLWSILNRLV